MIPQSASTHVTLIPPVVRGNFEYFQTSVGMVTTRMHATICKLYWQKCGQSIVCMCVGGEGVSGIT